MKLHPVSYRPALLVVFRCEAMGCMIEGGYQESRPAPSSYLERREAILGGDVIVLQQGRHSNRTTTKTSGHPAERHITAIIVHMLLNHRFRFLFLG